MDPPVQQWLQPLASSSSEDVLSISLESLGFVYVGGYTLGQLGTSPNAGGFDAFLARYNEKGERLWLKQIGTDSFDRISAVHADTRRAVYAAGTTGGQVGEEPHKGQTDAFIVKYDTLGNWLWEKQFGATLSEGIRALATDTAGNLFVGGSTNGSLDGTSNAGNVDGFVGKFDPDGNPLWIRQLGNSTLDFIMSVAVDPSGDVYAAGYTDGDFDGEADVIRSNGFIVKYNAQGDQIWSKEVGSDEADYLQAMACSRQGNLFVAGVRATRVGPEPQNLTDDAFIGKYNAQGEQLWLVYLGTDNLDGIYSLDVDEEENVFVGGYTRGQLGEEEKQGGEDAFLAKYNSQGTLLWLHQFGTAKDEAIQALAVDKKGAIYTAGYTLGQISDEKPQGGLDAFLAKYIQPKDSNQNPMSFPIPVVAPIQHIRVERPKYNEILPVQAQLVLDFLNSADEAGDITDIEKYRPDLSKEVLASYSIGEQGAQNILDARESLRAKRFNKLEEVLDVKAIGEDKILDIIEFIWLPTEEMFRQELFRQILGENWTVDYWRYALSKDEFERLEQNPYLLKEFVANKISEITRQRSDNYVVSSLAKALLEKTFSDRVDSLTARTQFASWWLRFDEDNWFSFERISEVIDPFLNYYNRKRGTYIDPVFFRGFQNGGTVADGISPDDLVVTLNPAEMAITIWGISLFD